MVGPSNPCLGSTFTNYDGMDHDGYDPLFSDDLKPPGSASIDKILLWYKDFPNDMHSEVDGMILKGRVLANAYILYFATIRLPSDMADKDARILFPFQVCSPVGA